MQKEKCTAIVLSAGQGSRMGTEIQKQYLEIEGRPVLYYSLEVFQESPLIDEIIVVAGAGQENYVKKEIVDRYGITKVREIVEGGAERYLSVWNGIRQVEEGYTFIHDGARPFIDSEILERVYEGVCIHKACVVAMPVKDTIKTVDKQNFVVDTPERSLVWLVQTPQVFKTRLVKAAYEKLITEGISNVTDDAMVVEMMENYPIKLVEGSYENIKITTPEDLDIAKLFVKRRK